MGLCEGKISDQLTHQLAVAVIGESANEWRVTFSLKTEYTIMLWRARTTKESGKEKKTIDFFSIFECRQVSGLISSSGQDELGRTNKSGWSKNTKKRKGRERKFLNSHQ